VLDEAAVVGAALRLVELRAFADVGTGASAGAAGTERRSPLAELGAAAMSAALIAGAALLVEAAVADAGLAPTVG
jgi:hypothetical protein